MANQEGAASTLGSLWLFIDPKIHNRHLSATVRLLTDRVSISFWINTLKIEKLRIETADISYAVLYVPSAVLECTLDLL